MRLVLLNGFPINAFNMENFIVGFMRIEAKHVATLLKYSDEIANYVRHPATVQLLEKLTGKKIEPSSNLYEYKEGDWLLIVTLKKPVRGIEVNEVSTEDLIFTLVFVGEGEEND